MNWLTITWCMAASACLTLGLLYLLIWLKDRRDRVRLMFAAAALAVAGLSVTEMMMALAQTPEEFGWRLRLAHVSVFVALVSIVWFVRCYFQAGRLWLAWSVCLLRTLVVILNFSFAPNANYSEITGLRQVSLIGGVSVSVAEGVTSQRARIGEMASLLLLVYVLDASIAVWRRGGAADRRRAVVVGGSIGLYVFLGAGHVAMIHAGLLASPYLISFAFLVPIAAVGFELSADVARAAQFARELEASQAEVWDHKQQMELAVSAAAMGLWRWDAARDQFWVSDRGRELLNLDGAKNIGMEHFVSALAVEDRERLRGAVAHSFSAGTDCDGEYRMPLSDGGTRWIAIRGRTELNDRQQAKFMRGVAFDVTARRNAERERVRQRNELAHLSRVAMLGELSGSLAHELNQPLTAILSNAQAAQEFLARNPTELGEVRSILQDIVDEDRRAGEVIRRLRLLFHKGETQYERVDVNDVVLEVLKLVNSELVNHEVSVKTNLGEGLPEVLGDRVQLQQVLINLMVNASDAMVDCPASKRRLEVSSYRENGEVHVTVADSGCGIDGEQLEEIFEPFYTTKSTGMGLGLAVCRTIMAAHCGRIWATNNPQGGACVHVTFSREDPHGQL